MPAAERRTLRDALERSITGAARAFHGLRASLDLAALARRSTIVGDAARLRGRRVLLTTADPLAAAAALVELDGVAQRMVLCPHGVAPEHLPVLASTAQCDAVLTDACHAVTGLDALEHLSIAPATVGCEREPPRDALETEWVLLTSGTSGVPKMAVHSLASLSGAIPRDGPLAGPLVWSTYYDIRRYGGLQIYLRALIGGGSLVLSDAREAIDEFLLRAAAHGVTHITGTPSHWRRALMGRAAHAIAPAYARMSGEIADQAIIDRLRAAYPQARVAHAFASTEAGVAFEVDDGLEGFPAALLDRVGASVELRIEDDTLRIRSARTASRYLGEGAPALRDARGFVDTGDVVQRRGERYYFMGRRNGVINVGGHKVHPEEIEAVIAAHPAVRSVVVRARRNPITGSVVVAEVVAADGDAAHAGLREELLRWCGERLPPHKIPASIRVAEAIELMASGKVARSDA